MHLKAHPILPWGWTEKRHHKKKRTKSRPFLEGIG